MKGIMKSSSPCKALLLAGLLALAFQAHAGYDAATWSPVDLMTNGTGNPYAYWNNPANWNTGVVPTLTNSVDGNLWGVHFAEPAGAIIPCVITNNTQVGQLVVGDYGGGGYLIITNAASFTAGTADGNWTGVGFPNGPGTLYVGVGSVVTLGGHLWVGNGTGAQGTVIVDGGTINIPNGQLGVSWNGIGGTNYITITNGGAMYLSQWASSTLGAPGAATSTNIGVMDLEDTSFVVVTNNQLGFMNALETNNQVLAFGGYGTIQAIYNPTLNTTTLDPLDGGAPPYPLVLPSSAVVPLGGTATFTALVGDGFQGYQWYLNGQPLADGNGISGSKTATLTIAGATAADAGNYFMQTSWHGQPTQTPSVSLSTEAVIFYPVVTIDGFPGNTYEVDYSTSISSPIWTPLTNVTLSSFTGYVVDPATPMGIVRYYRVVQH